VKVFVAVGPSKIASGEDGQSREGAQQQKARRNREIFSTSAGSFVPEIGCGSTQPPLPDLHNCGLNARVADVAQRGFADALSDRKWPKADVRWQRDWHEKVNRVVTASEGT